MIDQTVRKVSTIFYHYIYNMAQYMLFYFKKHSMKYINP